MSKVWINNMFLSWSSNSFSIFSTPKKIIGILIGWSNYTFSILCQEEGKKMYMCRVWLQLIVTLGRKESEGASLSPFMDTKDWVAKLTTNLWLCEWSGAYILWPSFSVLGLKGAPSFCCLHLYPSLRWLYACLSLIYIC